MRTNWLMICLLLATSMWVTHEPNRATAADTHPALNERDRFGWEVFVKICAPAKDGTNNAIWETWATDEDTFPQQPQPGQPPKWPAAPKSKRLTESRQGKAFEALKRRMGVHPGNRISLGGGQEIRRNREAFDFIADHELWHLDGILAAFARGDVINFPKESIEIKAQWKPIAETEKPKFHWNIDAAGTLYGLTALHITTKDIPNWYWATFEHVDNPNRGIDQGCRDNFGVDPPNSCNGSPSKALLDMMSKCGLPDAWKNYRLVDSQVDFVDATGRALIVGNSIIEGGFESTSSCITCHSRAAIEKDGLFLEFFTSNPFGGHIGAPDPEWFYNADGTRKAMQLDFVWGFLAARPLATRSLSSVPRSPQSRSILEDGSTGPSSRSMQLEPPKSVLELQEQEVEKLAVQPGKLPSPQDLQALGEAAAAFADKAAKDDQQAVQLFRQAMAAALPKPVVSATRSLPSSAREFNALPNPELPDVNSIFRDPRYVKNARKYLQTASTRIVGGMPVVGGTGTDEFLDCVAVGAPGQYCCSGTLVAKNVVVTAGHCAPSCAARVFVGTDSDKPSTGKSYEVASVHQHPDYNGAHQNDLTVLILKEDVTGVTPRAFATKDAIDSAFFVRAVGFGTTDFNGSIGYGIKRMVELPMASFDCAPADATRYGCDTGLEFVAGGLFNNKDTCSGDSGGPIYVDVGGSWFLAGATSRATVESVRTCGDGGIYVRMDKYQEWVKSIPGGHW